MAARPAKRIAVFVTGAYVHREYLDAVSGHVQIALRTARILSEAGHDVTLVTTRADGTDRLPPDLPPQVDIAVVPHATRSWPTHKVYPGKAARQVFQLWALTKRRRFDILHAFGGTATGLLLCLLKRMGAPFVAFYTPIRRPPGYRRVVRNAMMKCAFRQVEHFLPVTDYVSAGWAPLAAGRPVTVLRPGIVKPISDEPGTTPRDTVLFWRNAGHANGADLAVAAFRRLAPEYPTLRFVFAVRPRDRYEGRMREFAETVPNVDVHVFPYKPPVSLQSLLSRSLFVVQPFRELQINPQISTIETLCAGVPVITTDVESNRELVHSEETGLLVPPNDANALAGAMGRLLDDRTLRERLQTNCAAMTRRQWNWQSYRQELLKAYEHAGE